LEEEENIEKIFEIIEDDISGNRCAKKIINLFPTTIDKLEVKLKHPIFLEG